MAAFIGAFSLLSFFAPKDEYSLWERRNLTKFPTLSVETVMNGSFMANFEEYATDSFSFRNAFRRVRAMWDNYVFLKNDTNDLYIMKNITDSCNTADDVAELIEPFSSQQA